MGFAQDGWERQMFADFYRLAEKFWQTDSSRTYWESVVNELDKFGKKYKEQSLGLSYTMAEDLGDYLDEKYRKSKGE